MSHDKTYRITICVDVQGTNVVANRVQSFIEQAIEDLMDTLPIKNVDSCVDIVKEEEES